jgi:hypothetical protein
MPNGENTVLRLTIPAQCKGSEGNRVWIRVPIPPSGA